MPLAEGAAACSAPRRQGSNGASDAGGFYPFSKADRQRAESGARLMPLL